MNAHTHLPEVTKFVVKLPAASLSKVAEVKRRLLDEFPRHTFRFEANEDRLTVRPVVIPVMEDQNGRAHLCRVPDRLVITRIFNEINDSLLETMPG